jgi:uncharacterized LabA/DUF88 family protein
MKDLDFKLLIEKAQQHGFEKAIIEVLKLDLENSTAIAKILEAKKEDALKSN